MAYEDPVAFAPAGARTTSGNSGAIPTGKGLNLHVLVAVTAVSGTTPSATFTVEWSHDGTTFAPNGTSDAFAAITAAGNVSQTFPVRAPFFRLVWTITGTTPSFTFSASRYVTL